MSEETYIESKTFTSFNHIKENKFVLYFCRKWATTDNYNIIFIEELPIKAWHITCKIENLDLIKSLPTDLH